MELPTQYLPLWSLCTPVLCSHMECFCHVIHLLLICSAMMRPSSELSSKCTHLHCNWDITDSVLGRFCLQIQRGQIQLWKTSDNSVRPVKWGRLSKQAWIQEFQYLAWEGIHIYQWQCTINFLYLLGNEMLTQNLDSVCCLPPPGPTSTVKGPTG